MHTHRSYRFGADCGTSLFVKHQTGVNNTVIPCVANDVALGVSHEGTRQAPIPDVAPLVAKEGETAIVYSHGEPCEIIAGGAIQTGQTLKPDANAKAVVAGASEHYSAIADSNAAPGEKVKVTIIRGVNPA